MGDPPLTEPGRTLVAQPIGKGFADLRARLDRYTLRRAALLVAAVGAVAVAMAATAAAYKGIADPGVNPALPGERVATVSATGFAWHDGIRPGQLVVFLSASDDESGWRLETLNADGAPVRSEARLRDAGLRESLPLATLALAAGVLGLLAVRTRRDWVLPATWAAFMAASTPLLLQGAALPSTVAMAGAALLPGVWIAGRLRGPVSRAVVGSLGLGFLSVWAVARVSGWDIATDLEAYRSSLGLVGGVALVADRTFASRPQGGSIRVMRPDIAEIVLVAALAAVGIALVTLLEISPLAIAVLIVAGAAVLPPLRRRVRPLENALLADVRAEAAAEASEAERARLARELHDVPLQELIAAIRRLEVVPGAEAISDDLRSLAGHLRDVAIDLRPPVLDDLGLPAALEELAEEMSKDGISVAARIVDTTTFDRTARPPSDVELAIFRIAAEAVSNAVRHSGSSEIEIRGEIAPERVDIEVADNGHGLHHQDATSRRGKHIGLSAMRRRAQAIDAELSIRSSGSGTQVHALWHA
jgi:signal transduction histidine kinase